MFFKKNEKNSPKISLESRNIDYAYRKAKVYIDSYHRHKINNQTMREAKENRLHIDRTPPHYIEQKKKALLLIIETKKLMFDAYSRFLNGSISQDEAENILNYMKTIIQPFEWEMREIEKQAIEEMQEHRNKTLNPDEIKRRLNLDRGAGHHAISNVSREITDAGISREAIEYIRVRK